MDVDIVVNLRSRRGSRTVTQTLERELPDARILESSSIDDVAEFLRGRDRSLIVSAGGDGTAVGLLNSMRAEGTAPLALGLLPLGTGNAWAHATGAPPWSLAARRLGLHLREGTPVPVTRFGLIEVGFPEGETGGGLAHFAGTGWDAEVIDDFHAQRESFGLLPATLRRGLSGYLNGVLTRTIPRHLFMRTLPEVEIENTGAPALTVDDDGNPVPIPDGGPGAVLYRGPATVCAAGTIETWGFGFRAFPFAGLVPGRFCLRVYAGGVGEATLSMRRLWKGAHPMPKMYNFLVNGVRARFSRPVPFQAGGDRLGHRRTVDYGLARETADLLDWRRVAAAA
jgi:Diacylglycerol kinase catalytic domain